MIKKIEKSEFIDEDKEWLLLSPAERLTETTKLWDLYIRMGGNLDPEPDFQSPFYSPEEWRQMYANRRASLHYIRRS